MIAIIDDDAAVREATAALLRSLGYVTIIFSSATEFLRSNRKQEATCVISDIKMPDMTGMALKDRLAREQRTVPFIFITAYPDAELQKRALSLGAHGFLTKPYRQESLLDCVRSAMQHHVQRPAGGSGIAPV